MILRLQGPFWPANLYICIRFYCAFRDNLIFWSFLMSFLRHPNRDCWPISLATLRDHMGLQGFSKDNVGTTWDCRTANGTSGWTTSRTNKWDHVGHLADTLGLWDRQKDSLGHLWPSTDLSGLIFFKGFFCQFKDIQKKIIHPLQVGLPPGPSGTMWDSWWTSGPPGLADGFPRDTSGHLQTAKV